MHSSSRKSPRPPRLADRLLEWFCAPHLLEELQGDLHEEFEYQIDRIGERRARRRYWLDVLGFLRPFAVKRNPTPYTNPLITTMLRNYFKVAWRNTIHHKTFSGINILGLSLGMVCSLLICLWIQDELRVDADHANGPYLYNVMGRHTYESKVEVTPTTPGLLESELRKEFPEIKYTSGFLGSEVHTMEAGDKINKEKGAVAGADWFKMFSIPLLEGTAESALSSPNSLAVSRKIAEIYFGSPQAAIGRSIRIDNQTDYRVTAVFENLPATSSDQYDYLMNWKDFINRNEWAKDWGNHVVRTRIQVRPDARVAQLEGKLTAFLERYNPNLRTGTFKVQLFLQPFQESYLYSGFKNGYPDGGRIEYIRLFGIVAVFILLLACINFMNLATARSVRRAREVGVRKVVGADRWLLIGQFLGEAMLLAFFALAVALVAVWLALPAFNHLTEKQISLRIDQPSLWLLFLGTTLVTGLVAGSYPALFLSSLHPIRVLKGTLRLGFGGRMFRRGLVVFQFSLSVLLIAGTVITYRQIRYSQTKNLGYDRANLIYLRAEGEIGAKYPTFKQELLRVAGIRSVTYMDGTPTSSFGGTTNVSWPGKDPMTKLSFQFSTVDYDFTKTLKVKLSGRDFSKDYGTDSVGYLINETAARRIGYREPLGKPLTMWGKTGTIIGVMKDYHLGSLHLSIEPLIVKLSERADHKTILIRTEPGQTQQAILGTETLWRRLNPKLPFSYKFVDEEYRNLYRRETVVGTMANYFAGLAIFISCLGLFGLAAFTAEQRKKEIGVRKVLGASTGGIVAMLSGEFLKLVLIAVVLASPIGWYILDRWLQQFAYRVDVEWWVFALAGLAAMVIALLTVSFQSVKAAFLNPVKSLRAD